MPNKASWTILWLTLVLFLCATPVFAQYNSNLTIVCPNNYEISLNNHVQADGVRSFGFNHPVGQSYSVNVMMWEKGSNIVKYQAIHEIYGGKNNVIDINKKTEKPKRGLERPNFKGIISCETNTREKRFSSGVHVPVSVGSTPTSGICVTY